jgi:outer membrane protein
MKQLSLILSGVALVISGAVFYQQMNNKKPSVPALEVSARRDISTVANTNFRIAYFDMDSIENNYQYFKDALNAIKSKEESLNNELLIMDRSYKKKIQEWQQKGNTMSQSETEAANREYQQMQQEMTNRRTEMQQTMENLKNDEMSKIRKRLENFLKEYNKENRYNFIFSYTPEFMFYKDSLCNITVDVVKGLNESYKKKN